MVRVGNFVISYFNEEKCFRVKLMLKTVLDKWLFSEKSGRFRIPSSIRGENSIYQLCPRTAKITDLTILNIEKRPEIFATELLQMKTFQTLPIGKQKMPPKYTFFAVFFEVNFFLISGPAKVESSSFSIKKFWHPFWSLEVV